MTTSRKDAYDLKQTNQVTLTTTAQQIVGKNPARAAIQITNMSTQTVFIGTGCVTSGCGLAILAGNSQTLAIISEIYGVSTTGTALISFIEVQ